MRAVLLVAVLLAAAAGAWSVIDIGLTVEDVETTILGLGVWGVLLSVALMVLHSFVPFPAEIVALANGMAYGWLWGTVVTWIGAMLGAIVAFALARAFAPSLQQRWLSPARRALLARYAAEDAWWLLLTSRLMPVIAFNLINYAAGLAGVRWATFLWTTAVGISPLTVAMTVIGDGLSRPSWLTLGAVLALLLGMAWLLWRRHRA